MALLDENSLLAIRTFVNETAQDIREVAEGKCKTFVVSYNDTISKLKNDIQYGGMVVYDYQDNNISTAITNGDYDSIPLLNSGFNSQNNGINFSVVDDNQNYNYLIYQSNEGKTYLCQLAEILSKFKVGDIFLVYQTNVPDRWVSSNQGSLNLYKLETTKVDLSSYELVGNKVTSLSGSSTNEQYPSAKLVYDQLALKQDTLVSGTNIKTINGNSVLGSGDLSVLASSVATKVASDVSSFSFEYGVPYLVTLKNGDYITLHGTNYYGSFFITQTSYYTTDTGTGLQGNYGNYYTVDIGGQRITYTDTQPGTGSPSSPNDLDMTIYTHDGANMDVFEIAYHEPKGLFKHVITTTETGAGSLVIVTTNSAQLNTFRKLGEASEVGVFINGAYTPPPPTAMGRKHNITNLYYQLGNPADFTIYYCTSDGTFGSKAWDTTETLTDTVTQI